MAETPTTDYVDTDSTELRATLEATPRNSLARKWFAFRWQLARRVLARPIPLLASQVEVTQGDLLITLPLVIGILTWSAVHASNHNVPATGSPVSILMALTFCLAVRNNSILLSVTGIPFERVILYHKLFGNITWLIAILHGLSYLLNKRDTFEETTVVTGIVLFSLLTVLVLSSTVRVRRNFYHIFVRIHVATFFLIIIACVLHKAAVALIGFVPWLIDAVFRYGWRQRKQAASDSVLHASQVSVAMVADDIVRVQLPRTRTDTDTKQIFKYAGGQYVFVCFPEVARLEWHPFTIASAPHEPMVTIYIKVLGDWTKRVAEMAVEKQKQQQASSFDYGSGGVRRMEVLLDGPYGAEAIEMDHYSHFVFISGGVGVTPMLAMANELYYASEVAKTRQHRVQRASFVWSVRDRAMVQAILLDTTSADGVDEDQSPSWLPGRLLRGLMGEDRSDAAFRASIYLTRGQPEASQRVDQRLGHCLQHGSRPDIAHELRSVGEQARRDGKQRVGVLVCGPKSMVAEVAVQSALLSKTMDGVTFDVHHETFDF